MILFWIIALIVFLLGFIYSKSKIIASAQLIIIWIFMGWNSGGMDFRDNQIIYFQSGGLQGGFPAEKPQAWEKGCSKCTLLEYPLVIIFSCPPSISFAIDVFYADWKIFRELKA